ncbi:MtN3_slv domain-containing protein [Cephalotus follicularis]|uniref:MtN3_slv domain-containing protein n=1 Tax=Cephalotus follicularis TaxID=3775 RepID=A0A1Q3BL26_CEPFO|nr:MtN3_slv domain-containing protein [Cephalotus follicularis]
MIWTLFGLLLVHPNNTLVLTINGTGIGIELVCIILFFIYSSNKNRLKVVVVVLVKIKFVIAVAVVILTWVHTKNGQPTIVGIIAIVFNVMMYASPLSVMKLVITTNSVEYMPFFLSFASFDNGVAWPIYAFFPIDPFIDAPNGLGTLFSVAQLILYAIYYKNTKRILAAREGKGEVGLSNVVVDGVSKQNGHPHHHASKINGA